jgi:hypothetical protein
MRACVENEKGRASALPSSSEQPSYFLALSAVLASAFIEPDADAVAGVAGVAAVAPVLDDAEAAGAAGVAGVAGVAADLVDDVDFLLDALFLLVDFFVDFFMLSCFMESSDFVAGVAGAGVAGAAVCAIAAVVVTAKTPAIREASSLFMMILEVCE